MSSAQRWSMRCGMKALSEMTDEERTSYWNEQFFNQGKKNATAS